MPAPKAIRISTGRSRRRRRLRGRHPLRVSAPPGRPDCLRRLHRLDARAGRRRVRAAARRDRRALPEELQIEFIIATGPDVDLIPPELTGSRSCCSRSPGSEPTPTRASGWSRRSSRRSLPPSSSSASSRTRRSRPRPTRSHRTGGAATRTPATWPTCPTSCGRSPAVHRVMPEQDLAEVELYQMGGAVARVPKDATPAAAFREAGWYYITGGRGGTPTTTRLRSTSSAASTRLSEVPSAGPLHQLRLRGRRRGPARVAWRRDVRPSARGQGQVRPGRRLRPEPEQARGVGFGWVNRTAVVTGGASGIGLAIARRLAADGARVAILDLNGGAAEEAAGSIEGAVGLQADVADPPRSTERWKGARRLGRPTILVNNAGMASFDPFLEISGEIWQQAVGGQPDRHLQLLPGRRAGHDRGGWGRIVNISSSSAHSGARDGALRRGQVGRRRAAPRRLRSSSRRGHHREHNPAGLRRHADAAPVGGGRLRDIEQQAAATPVGGRGGPRTSPPRARSWSPTRRATSPASDRRQRRPGHLGSEHRARLGEIVAGCA